GVEPGDFAEVLIRDVTPRYLIAEVP
ncbi:MAG: TRAM domain-containing protein, partial [Candidatus Diapherotrites archaeon]|nr:TRAM domain-containing protein [Candidatus Diapherotrites archaeon]